MYTTDAAILQDVADALHVALAALPEWAANVVSQVHTAAYQEIYERLLSRGYTAAQIAAWTRGEEFERALSLWYYFTRPQNVGVFDKQALDVWAEYRKMLGTVTLATASGWQTPGDTPGTVGTGAMRDQVTSEESWTGSMQDGDGPTGGASCWENW